MSQRAALTRRFRKVGWGRLYWKRSNPRMRRFESDDVCLVLNGTVCIHYKALDAFQRELEEVEQQPSTAPAAAREQE